MEAAGKDLQSKHKVVYYIGSLINTGPCSPWGGSGVGGGREEGEQV